VCHELGISFTESHRAKADAEACAEVGLKLAKHENVQSMRELSEKLLVRPGSISGSVLSGTRSKSRTFPSSLSKRDAEAFLSSISEDELSFDEDFRGKEVIFTGALASMERKVAQEKVLLAGGTTGNNVTKKTSIVVVGAPYDSELQPGGQISGKLRKVIDLRKAGLDIEILTEFEFLELFEN
jgi:DNA polymerase-3 subunit epsilon